MTSRGSFPSINPQPSTSDADVPQPAIQERYQPPSVMSRPILVVVSLVLFLAASGLAWSPTTPTTTTTPHPSPQHKQRHGWVANRRQAIQAGIMAPLLFGGSMIADQCCWANNDDHGDDETKLLDGPRGIQYQVLQTGDGPSPQRGQKVSTQYTLWTGGFDGNKVDGNTGLLGRPFSVVAGTGRVIKGWDLILLEMKVGEKRRIVVPSDLGYGSRGAGGKIPPNTPLYFEMELTSIEPIKEYTAEQKQWLQDNPL